MAKRWRTNHLLGRLAACAAVAVALWAEPAAAHPEYERHECSDIGENGQVRHFVKSYTDGIFRADPVKLIVRDSSGHTLDETDYGRDIGVMCWRAAECYVFRHEGSLAVFPVERLRLQGTVLVPADSPWWGVIGLLVSIRDHWLGYTIATSFLLGPIAAFQLARRSSARNYFLAMASVVVFGAVVWMLSLYALVALSRLSLPVMLLVGLFTLGLVRHSRRARPRGSRAGA